MVRNLFFSRNQKRRLMIFIGKKRMIHDTPLRALVAIDPGPEVQKTSFRGEHEQDKNNQRD